MWIAWALLEAGRLWDTPQHTEVGKALLARIADEEVATVPGLGSMILPGRVGFVDDRGWRFNPSYLPPQLATYFAAVWRSLAEDTRRQSASAAGNRAERFSPDWVRYEKKQRLAAESG